MILSDAPRTLPHMTPHPWRRLAEDWPDVQVRHVDLGARWELTRWEQPHPVIYLHEKLTQVQRRAAVTHATEHLILGPPPTYLRGAVERRVVAATARYLLPDMGQIADALATYDARRAAHELWVPWSVLVDRLNGLTDSESDYVHARRDQEEDVA